MARRLHCPHPVKAMFQSHPKLSSHQASQAAPSCRLSPGHNSADSPLDKVDIFISTDPSFLLHMCVCRTFLPPLVPSASATRDIRWDLPKRVIDWPTCTSTSISRHPCGNRLAPVASSFGVAILRMRTHVQIRIIMFNSAAKPVEAARKFLPGG